MDIKNQPKKCTFTAGFVALGVQKDVVLFQKAATKLSPQRTSSFIAVGAGYHETTCL